MRAAMLCDRPRVRAALNAIQRCVSREDVNAQTRVHEHECDDASARTRERQHAQHLEE